MTRMFGVIKLEKKMFCQWEEERVYLRNTHCDAIKISKVVTIGGLAPKALR